MVKINDVAVLIMVYKSSSLVVATGSGLKVMVSKGVTVQVVVVNPDGGKTQPFSYAR